MLRTLGWLLIAVPIFYYFGLIVGAATHPDYSHVTNYASELGMAEAPYPAIFNVSAILSGMALLASAALMAVKRTGFPGPRLWVLLACLAIALWGTANIMAGIFPIPDERHGAFGLGLAELLVPLFLLLAIRTIPDARAIKLFLVVVLAVSVALMAIMFGVGELVTRANVGLWQRFNSLFSIGWLAVFGFWVLTRLARSENTGD